MGALVIRLRGDEDVDADLQARRGVDDLVAAARRDEALSHPLDLDRVHRGNAIESAPRGTRGAQLADSRSMTRRWGGLGLAVAAAAALAGMAAAAKPLVVTENGVRGLKLGKPLADARRTGLIGPTGPGCELASPRPLVARLRSPLKGFATFDGKAPHPLVALDVTGGAITVKHVGVGDSASKARSAYPNARLLVSKPDDPLQLTALIVTRGGKDRMWLMLNKPGGHVTDIDIPIVQACEVTRLWHPFAAMGAVEGGELVIARGEGARVWDADGREYLDATAGLWFATSATAAPSSPPPRPSR